MVQSKIKVHENGVGASRSRSTTEVDHWAFLEEFEAPMWADLSLEPKLLTEDKDDSWFHTSHSFHHHSARHLRSAFAHSDVGNDLFNVNLQGTSSPHLPSSVSKSRGRDYSRDGRSNCSKISLNTGHPISDLGDRSSILKTTTIQESKDKVSGDNPSEASSLIADVVNDDSETRVGLNAHLASTSGISSSTITTVSLQQDSKVLGVLKEVGHVGSLLNDLRTNLRKSRATRPPSRVEISSDREPKDCKSSAGKSSVGSSSIGNDTKGKGPVVVPKTDQCKQSKTKMSVDTGTKVHQTSFVEPNLGFSNSKIEVKKTEDCSKQNRNRNANVREFKKLENPINGRVKDIKMGGASVCSRNVTNSSNLKSNDAATRNNSCNSNIKGAAAGAKNDSYSSKVKGNAAGAKIKMGGASVCSRNVTNSSKLKSNDAATRNNSCNSNIKGAAAGAKNDSYSSKVKGSAAGAGCSGKNTLKSKVSLQMTENSLNKSKIGFQGAKGKLGSSQFNRSACSGKENMRGRAVLNNRSGGKDNMLVVSAKGKVGSSQFNRSACSGKENMRGRAVLNDRSGGKDNMLVVSVSDHKVSKQKSKHRVGVPSVGSKVRDGKMDDGSMSMDTRIHLR